MGWSQPTPIMENNNEKTAAKPVMTVISDFNIIDYHLVSPLTAPLCSTTVQSEGGLVK